METNVYVLMTFSNNSIKLFGPFENWDDCDEFLDKFLENDERTNAEVENFLRLNSDQRDKLFTLESE